jgi:hypothetical protein
MIQLEAAGATVQRQGSTTPLAKFSSTRAALRALIRLNGAYPEPGTDSRIDLDTEARLRRLLDL